MSDKEEDSCLGTGIGKLQISDADTEFSREEFVYSKQPMRQDQRNKAAERLRKPARPRAGGSVSSSLQPNQFMQQQQQSQQQSNTSSPVTPVGQVYGSIQSPFQQQWEGAAPQLQQQQQHQLQGFEDTNEGFDSLLELLNGPTDAGPSGGAPLKLPGSRADIVITASSGSQVQPPPPPPLPPPPPQLPSQPHAAASASAMPSAGCVGKAPVSESVRLALIKKLNPQSILVDENFNSQLHTALLQNQPRDAVDFLLCNLRRQKKLLPIINLVNLCGHTPLSLCLKMRRGDLISLLIDFDAAPTQLCCCVSERTNHFHYAFAKCLDSVASIQMIQTLISCVIGQHQSDLMGLHAKDRFRKTPLDYLNHRISQLTASQQDPASTELLAQMQWLKNHIYGFLPRFEPGHDQQC